MLDSCKMLQKQSEAFHKFLWRNFIAYHSSKMSSRPDYIFEIPQLWQSGFSRVYSNSCCSCSFELEIIKNGQSSHKVYSNKILYFKDSTTILNACTKTVRNLIESTMCFKKEQIRRYPKIMEYVDIVSKDSLPSLTDYPNSNLSADKDHEFPNW